MSSLDVASLHSGHHSHYRGVAGCLVDLFAGDVVVLCDCGDVCWDVLL